MPGLPVSWHSNFKPALKSWNWTIFLLLLDAERRSLVTKWAGIIRYLIKDAYHKWVCFRVYYTPDASRLKNWMCCKERCFTYFLILYNQQRDFLDLCKNNGILKTKSAYYISYRVFIKYCVFCVGIFLNSASSAAALVFYLQGVCTHTDTEGK